MIINGMNIYNEALVAFGKEMQKDIAIEEMAELTKELIKERRGKISVHNICAEIADVEIMIEQLKMLYGEREVNSIKSFKQGELYNRILGYYSSSRTTSEGL